MNRFSLDEYNRYHPYYDWYDHYEVYGVSGVSTNCYDPNDPESCNCTDRCVSVGQKECEGNAVKTCGNHDDDECLEWSLPVPCGQNEVCQDGQCHSDCSDDDYEDNDSFDQASPLTDADLQICSGDDDWFRIEASSGDTLAVEIFFSHSGGDLDMELFHQNNLEQSLATGVSATDNERISRELEADGVYYLKVYGYNSARNSYRMTIDLTRGDDPPPDECTDSFEPNDVTESAAVIQAGNYEALRICEGDEDWFALELQAGQTVSVLVSFSHASGDLDIQLLDVSQGNIDSGISVDDDESIEFTVSDAGTYYLKVYGYNNAVNSYDLAVSMN
jgi:hypothetical protein